MHRKIIQILFLLAFASATTALGRQDSSIGLHPNSRLSQAILESWGEDEGLPQSSVRAIAQTQDGYLWFGTQGGLASFNGHTFATFNRSNTPAFSGSHGIRSLLEAYGSLWVGTTGSGLLKLHDGQPMAQIDGLQDGSVTTIALHPDGTLWAATFGQGILVLDSLGTTLDRWDIASGLPDDYVTALEIEPNGTAWVGTKKGLARIYGGKISRWSTDSGMPSAEVTSLGITSGGVLMVGTATGMRLFDGREFTPGIAAEAAAVTVQFEDRWGSRWIGTSDQGVIRISWQGVERLDEAEGLTHSAVTAIFEDREGSVWIGTDGGGLNRLRSAKFETVSKTEGLASDMAYGVWMDPDGAIWVGSDDAGVTVAAGGTFRTITTEQGLSSNNVMAIMGTPDGYVWAATFGGGLNRIAPNGEITVYTAEDGLTHDVLSSLAVDDAGTLWIGSDGGITALRDGAFEQVTVEDGLPSPYIMAVAPGLDGSLWAGTYDGGLVEIRDSGVFVTNEDDGLGNNMVLAVHQTENGDVWAATFGGGISRLRDGQITTLTMKEGLVDDVVYALVEDDLGQFWMTSNQGLFSVPRGQLDAMADGREERLNPTRYGRQDGLRSREFNGGFQPAAWKGEDGRLIFPSIKGIAVISPSSIPSNPVPPTVHVEAILVDGQASDFRGRAESPISSGRLELRFAGLSYLVPGNVAYRYRLVGYDDAWTDTQEPKAVYTNLPPGAFRFEVEAANNDGLWSESAAQVTLTRAPKFWETPWFIALCLVLAGLATWTGVRLRLRAMRLRQRQLEETVQSRTRDLREEKERVEHAKGVIQVQADKLKELDRFKTRFFANVSHEFRTPLTMIVGPLENALKGSYGTLSDGMKRQSQIMLRNALRLLSLINQLMDLSKLESDSMPLKAGARNIVSFVSGLQETVAPLAEKKGIETPFSAAAEAIEVYFEPDKMEKVFYNLLSNALKFTKEGGTVGIRVEESATSVTVTVHDTGAGIPEDQLATIFDRFHQVEGTASADIEGTGIGLALVKEMVTLHGGTVEATSVLGQGTAFAVTLLKGSDHLKSDQIVDGPDTETETASVSARLASVDLLTDELDEMGTWTRVNGDAPLILVAEDNPDVRGYIVGILEEHGFRTAKAVDGVDGLEKARARKPKLILSDVMMPRMDGLEFCRSVKADATLRHIPFVLLTARATHESTLEGLGSGADDYLPKPFNVSELLARIANLLKGREEQQRLVDQTEELNRRVEEQVNIILEQRKSYEATILHERDRAVAASQLKQNILDNVNHEFRTPLTAIMGFAEILTEVSAGDEKEFVCTIKENGERLLETLDGLLNLANLLSGAEMTERSRIELGRLVGNVVQEAKAEILRPELEIVFDGGSDPAMAEVNDAAITRATAAVLDNAIKFTDAGRIYVRVRNRERGVEISIADQGIGIAEDKLEEVFEPFKQISEGLTRSHGGVGIGLSIARELVDDHGGTIRIAPNSPQRGVTVTIWLPGMEAGAIAHEGDRAAQHDRARRAQSPSLVEKDD